MNNINLDMRDTAGWCLMEHEERVKKLLDGMERRDRHGKQEAENTDCDYNHQG